MKPVRLIGTAALFLLLGIAAPAFAQQDKPDNHGGQGAAKPAQQESKPAPQQQAKPAQRQQAAPARQQQQAAPARQQQQAKPAQQQQQARTVKPQQQSKPAQQQQQARATKPQQQAKPAQQQQQARASKPAAQPASRQTQQPQQVRAEQNQSGQRGPERTASAQQTQHSQPAVRESARNSTRIPDDRFRSNFGQGHNFRMGNPEMVGGYSRFQYGGFWFGFVDPWPVDWYYTDDVYIDYVDGEYFLFDPYYPGERMEISVVM